MRNQLPMLNNYMKILNRKSPPRYFKEILSALNHCMVEGILNKYVYHNYSIFEIPYVIEFTGTLAKFEHR